MSTTFTDEMTVDRLEKRHGRETITFERFVIVYSIAGLMTAAALLFPETTEHPTRYRIIYSIWTTTALLIPTVCFFFLGLPRRLWVRNGKSSRRVASLGLDKRGRPFRFTAARPGGVRADRRRRRKGLAILF